MKATFRVVDHPLLLEATPGSLFTPVGPDLVECVCAVRSCDNGMGIEHARSNRQLLNASGTIEVVVIACRVSPGEPEFFPAGFTMELPSVAPIHFLTQTAPAQFAATPSNSAMSAVRVMPIHTDPWAPDEVLRSAGAGSANLTRAELASRL
ncbi:hypothetical protein [Pinirhizobacter sp.]|jgi:hypothetical protein|uniref:hypothetical protein n=1 Tax=Pinirhizobacter sp. TaxID=2950432 RepID=UPI002F41EEE8